MDDFERCKCDCHKSSKGLVNHIMPCCRICPWCDAPIKFAYFVDHENRCRPKRAPTGWPKWDLSWIFGLFGETNRDGY